MTAPRKVAKGVALSLGALSASVSMTSALMPRDRETSNFLVCAHGHEPRRVRSPRICDTCGEVAQGTLSSARKKDDGIVILPKEVLEAAAPAEETKKRATVGIHPRDQVELNTGVGDKAYYLHPEPGHASAYAALAQVVVELDTRAFLVRWTPRSQQATFWLHSVGGVLLMQERTLAGSLREAPESPGEADPKVVRLAAQLARKMVTKFDPAEYADAGAQELEKAIAALPVVQLATDGTERAETAVEDLAAALRADIATRAPARRKKVGK